MTVFKSYIGNTYMNFFSLCYNYTDKESALRLGHSPKKVKVQSEIVTKLYNKNIVGGFY